MTDPQDRSSDHEAQAAEYVLGLMDRDARAAFEARLAQEDDLRAEVSFWQERFAQMALAEIEEVAPPRGLEAKIKADLFGQTTVAKGSGFWSGLWRGAALASVLGAVLIIGLVALNPLDPVLQGPRLTADLSGEQSDLVLAALYTPEVGVLQITRASGDIPTERARELWLIVGEAAPVSLGLLAAGETTAIEISEELRPVLAGAILAVSDEPLGGSPSGAPTGDVLAVGQILEI